MTHCGRTNRSWAVSSADRPTGTGSSTSAAERSTWLPLKSNEALRSWTVSEDDLRVYDDATGLRVHGWPGDILRLDKHLTNALCYCGHHEVCPGQTVNKYGPNCVCPCHEGARGVDQIDAAI